MRKIKSNSIYSRVGRFFQFASAWVHCGVVLYTDYRKNTLKILKNCLGGSRALRILNYTCRAQRVLFQCMPHFCNMCPSISALVFRGIVLHANYGKNSFKNIKKCLGGREPSENRNFRALRLLFQDVGLPDAYKIMSQHIGVSVS